jgi:excisionase family DNA binding protein
VNTDDGDPLLLPGEVAAMFRVNPQTVTRWATENRLPSVRTIGGHHRFKQSVILALLESSAEHPPGDT